MGDTGNTERKFNPNEYIPPVMAIGTWLFTMYQAAHGIHYVPDEWVLGIVLSPYGSDVYLFLRERASTAIKRIKKKD